ncbi:MAG: DUF502 domain-containing protein [bacterium]
MKTIFEKIKKTFLTGLFVILPLILTIYIIRLLFVAIDSLLGGLMKNICGYYIPGFGIFAIFIIIFTIGLITRNILGQKILQLLENLILKIPFAQKIYLTSKQFTKVISQYSKQSFIKTVFVEYPRKGLYGIGFITSLTSVEVQNNKCFYVFFPTTPNPTSGFLLLIPEQDIISTNISIEAGIKLIVSGGFVIPHK